MDVGLSQSLAMVAFSVIPVVLGVLVFYVVVRLAVRHGVRDVFTERDRMLQEPQPVAGRDRR